MSRRAPRLNTNPDMSESMADTHSATPQPGSDEGAVLITAGPSTSPADEKTDSRCGVNKIARLGRQLRSMKDAVEKKVRSLEGGFYAPDVSDSSLSPSPETVTDNDGGLTSGALLMDDAAAAAAADDDDDDDDDEEEEEEEEEEEDGL
ncbi:hypothetical protein SprV_0602054700 [Sparganum proliferum]